MIDQSESAEDMSQRRASPRALHLCRLFLFWCGCRRRLFVEEFEEHSWKSEKPLACCSATLYEMASSKSTVYFSCLVLLALVAPTLAVNRLFVDKLSGYHQELVTAEDIDTGAAPAAAWARQAAASLTPNRSSQDHPHGGGHWRGHDLR